MSRDGSFVTTWTTATNVIEIDGRWSVQGGLVTMTMTNVVGTDSHSLGPPVQRYRIARIGSREMVSYMGGETNVMERK